MRDSAMEKAPCPRCRKFTYLYESPGMGIKKRCSECFDKELQEKCISTG